jgi:hypothetical protein
LQHFWAVSAPEDLGRDCQGHTNHVHVEDRQRKEKTLKETVTSVFITFLFLFYHPSVPFSR